MSAARAGDAPGDVGPADEVVWHDLECGGYRADLPAWRGLARAASPRPGESAILDIGAGSGRVALDLAAAGHRVSAIDVRPPLLAALRERAAALGLAVDAVCADARTFALPQRDHALCIVPMQTLQLLGGADGRLRFLARAHLHLRTGALLACAIVTDFDRFDAAAGDALPTPERLRVGGRRYESRPTCVRVDADTIVIERERRILAAPGAPAATPARDVVVLDRLSPAQLVEEAHAAGFAPAGERWLEATEDHVGSAVVMLRA